MAGVFKSLADVGGAAILPDDGIVDRPAGAAVPDHHGFPLIGDADCRDVGRGQAAIADRLARGREDGGPDLLRVVLDPARPGVDLGEFLLRRGHRGGRRVEHDGTGGGRSLIDDEDVPRHGVKVPWMWGVPGPG
jgi:hypothetical protein